jgi:hypothetical protein
MNKDFKINAFSNLLCFRMSMEFWDIDMLNVNPKYRERF